ncbi:hypothetical protein DE146DRAFT_628248 [Phaeosphaeria sp. MPI-PUGE-AT-0046c]|nr:hypothetical protein DE146DRAFT_628248 [Phaeosphaeria sp. MPI-PUGE-AT-0046c]
MRNPAILLAMLAFTALAGPIAAGNDPTSIKPPPINNGPPLIIKLLGTDSACPAPSTYALNPPGGVCISRAELSAVKDAPRSWRISTSKYVQCCAASGKIAKCAEKVKKIKPCDE